ncbi:MAG: tRNA uridine-5-carboxymethylaminomethyl(34) synthesis GTPase MnmE [Synergistaceae bacterium]|jgi:tRNA modification GTPase|nr:tRNA uridine-5-carboxymethylaminomethyl(34) synthesis GTPase MnmE [Synergistaceae bacterium]
MIPSGDIIAAVATAWGEGAIAVVRLSGEGSVALADAFFRGKRPLRLEPARRMALGYIMDGGAVVDQALAVRFERGASYTGEESVEIHCHGGVYAARKCLGLFMSRGSRLALPGEFTKRAFLSGRIDLAQAEAVLGVVRARGDAELVSSGRSLQGELSMGLKELSSSLTALRAEIEARIDFPGDVDDAEYASYARGVSAIHEKTVSLLGRCRVGLALANGIRVAIAGRPNAGKSSLLNAMLGSDRAIVTDIPGTTRDTLDAALIHRGMSMTLVDTAGMRDIDTARAGADMIESMGVERSRAAIGGADFCVLVLDASSPPEREDFEAARAVSARPAILAMNKRDLGIVLSGADTEKLGNFIAAVETSAPSGHGVNELKDALFEAALGSASPYDGMMATERMVSALESAANCVEEAARALDECRGADIAGSLLSEAAELIASLLGGDASEELLDAIFGSFCVGK